jgi:hypothetical protein
MTAAAITAKTKIHFHEKFFNAVFLFLAAFYRRADGAKTVHFMCQAGPAHGSAI